MKAYLLVTLSILLFGCTSSPSVHTKFSDTKYKRVMLSNITGDTSDYVGNRLFSSFSGRSDIEILGPKQIEAELEAMGLKAPRASASKQELSDIAKKLNAQAFFIGRVRSGAMAISESTTIHSTVELDLVDTATGEVIVSTLEEDTSVSRMMLDSTSLENVSSKTIESYRRIINSLLKP